MDKSMKHNSMWDIEAYSFCISILSISQYNEWLRGGTELRENICCDKVSALRVAIQNHGLPAIWEYNKIISNATALQ